MYNRQLSHLKASDMVRLEVPEELHKTRRATETRSVADAAHDRGVALARNKQFSQAIQCFQQALDIDPTRINTWRNLALAYTQSHQTEQAEKCHAEIVALQPESADALQEWAKLLRRLKRFGEAAERLAKAADLEPCSARAHMELGLTLAEAELGEQAKKAYLRALELQPDYADALNNLGVLYQDMGRLDESAGYLRRATRIEPRGAGAHNNLGVVLAVQRRFEEANECYHKALAIEPDYAIAWNNLGNSLRSLGRNREAIHALDRALSLKPDYAEAANNLAIAHLQLGEPETALKFYDRALLLRPDYAEAHMNRALVWLSLGELQNGWADYEWRWKLKSLSSKMLPGPRWDGSPLQGKRVLVRYEQGLGDTFHFVRYLADLKQRGATVIFEGKAETRAILSRTPGIDQFVDTGSNLPSYDFWTCLLSLPGHLGTTLETIPTPIPYIHPDVSLFNAWKERMAALSGIKVGIAWQGNPQHRGDRQRSIPLRQFGDLAAVPGVQLISLQRGFGCEQIDSLNEAFSLVTFDGVNEDADAFLRTAAIIKNLDLVVTIDSAIAHLAGAMGVPVWVAMPFAPDWRWLRGREDSPWYPAMRLFRQTELGAWSDVFSRIVKALSQRIASEPTNIPRDPATAGAKRREGCQLMSSDKLKAAREVLELAVAADPLDPDSHHDLGVALARQGHANQAIPHFRRALELRPASAGTYANLGLAFLHNDQIDEAITHLRKAITLGGGTPDVYNNHGIALMRLSKPAKAVESYLHALYLKPDYAAAHYNLARALLLQGQYEQGWLEFEWRTKCLTGCGRKFVEPSWTGSDLEGRTILLYAEQGFGDTIQFARFVQLVKHHRPKRIVLECQPPLTRLLARCEGIDQVVPAGDPLPSFDVQAALMSLPAILGVRPETALLAAPYVFADDALCENWKNRLAELPGLRVGICWQGNRN